MSGGRQLNSDGSLNRAYIFIRGFEIQSVTGDFHLGTSIQLSNSITFITYIKTSSTCRIQNVFATHIFVDTSKFIVQKIFVYEYKMEFQSDSDMQLSIPAHYEINGHIIFGFNSWKGINLRTSSVISFNLVRNNTILSI